ncbi:MAG TPA: ATP-binding protein, partial [Alphaproteobacteria bacterium]
HAAAKGLVLKLEMDPNVPRFTVGDPVRLRQVLLNLTGNAIKFTSEGSVTLQVRPNQRTGAPEGSSVHKLYFGVKDTGIGISKDAQQNLFNPFAQADNSITRKFGGTGLGLAISQRLIEAMGGRIQIDSAEGHGSTFYFIITMEEGNAGNAAAQSSGSSGKMQKSSKSLRIMIVEDNEINQRLLKEFVDRMGHQVTLAGSGEEALKLIATHHFDMVLMDIELPGMSGMGTTKAIRALADDHKASLPVIALSGNVRDEDIRACYVANMNGHLSKPVDPKRLNQMIDKVINGGLDNPVVLNREKGDTSPPPRAEAAVPARKPATIAAPEKPVPEILPGGEQAPIMGLALAEDAEDEQDEDSFSAAINTPDPIFTNQAAATAIFDPAPLRDLRRSMPSVQFAGLIGALLDKMAELVVALQKHPLNKDLAGLSARAHELKGMTGNYGLREISMTAAKIEKDAREGRTMELPALIASLPDKDASARKAIDCWMDEKNF